MHTSQIFQAWGKILKGEPPSLSIEITKECPLRCPGCYAYDTAHLGGAQTLRDLNDRRDYFRVADNPGFDRLGLSSGALRIHNTCSIPPVTNGFLLE